MQWTDDRRERAKAYRKHLFRKPGVQITRLRELAAEIDAIERGGKLAKGRRQAAKRVDHA